MHTNATELFDQAKRILEPLLESGRLDCDSQASVEAFLKCADTHRRYELLAGINPQRAEYYAKQAEGNYVIAGIRMVQLLMRFEAAGIMRSSSHTWKLVKAAVQIAESRGLPHTSGDRCRVRTKRRRSQEI